MGRGLSTLQKSILAAAKQERYVRYEVLLESLWPTPVQAGLAALGVDADPSKVELFHMLLLAPLSGGDWHRTEKYLSETEPEVCRALLAYEQAQRQWPSREASLSRALARLEGRGLIQRVDVARRDERGEWVSRPQRAICLTVKPE